MNKIEKNGKTNTKSLKRRQENGLSFRFRKHHPIINTF